MPTLFDSRCRDDVLKRLRGLEPDRRPLWGTMTAPQMVAHLTDQMRHTLGDAECRPVPNRLLRFPPIRYLVIYLLPWPRGRVQGPPDAFVTVPVDWTKDLNALVALVERLGTRDPKGHWPNHAIFGPMTGRDWGYFCFKHFNHHLRQFGQ